MRKLKKLFLLVMLLGIGVLAACDKKCTPSSEWSFDDTKHWHECVDCKEALEVTNHELKWSVKTAATCKVALVEEGVCACGYTTTRTGAKSAHKHEDLDGTAPTCEETGLTDGEKCSVCGEILEAQKDIPALGHMAEAAVEENHVDSTCEELGHYDLVVYCGVCDEELSREEKTIELKPHTEVLIPEKAPTCEESGLTEGKKCSVCEEILEVQKDILALGHDIVNSYYEMQNNVMMLVEICSRCGTLLTEIDINEQIEVNNYNDLLTILTAGYNAILVESVDLPTAIVISKDVELTVAAGVEITLKEDTIGDGAFRVINGATLIINSEGVINSVGKNDYNMAIWANGGNVIINGGTYTNVGANGKGPEHFDLIYISAGGFITINDGIFIAQTPKWTLNIKDDDQVGKFIVNGGLFKDYDPANSLTELTSPTNFVAEGYGTIEKDGMYTLIVASIEKAMESAVGTEVQITGTVSRIYQPYSEQYKNISVYIKDALGNEILAFRLKGNVSVGDIIKVNGVIAVYQEINQIGQDCTFEMIAVHTCVYNEATCTTPKTCQLCGATDGQTIPHIDAEHDHKCDNCKVNVGEHEDKDDDILCDYCGKKIGDNNPVVETLAEFTFGDNADKQEHVDGPDFVSSKTFDSNEYTLKLTAVKAYYPSYDAKGNSCLKLGSSSAIGSIEFIVPDNVTEVVIYVAQYKAKTSKVDVNGVNYSLTTSSDNGLYTAITIDTTTNKTVKLSTVTGAVRCMINTIVFNGYAQ